ncbi:imidazoleglycerol-phosphate dehydratase HisB [Thermodesulforhabdus norvegica]|uniref:Imidazoleglycerol-phosphate dehydratase n=1 Tax=Thermodesulforhabdus norvegica TaxID=39841 RepID=A0A1I4VY89_9BACT|nr:imidazoleglycerol-phosphate dehydratase HisB [Thermodesulforhabdus norvegica]SFN06213.1 imidazoleglycerol-phosphate dehydratase [Thermodesulforhabdus norvegica]
MEGRSGSVKRRTKETEVEALVNLDGTGKVDVSTGIGFFDHMLTLMAVHGALDLKILARGDLHVDCHHTVEDVGLCLGEALDMALGNREQIRRYGYACIPMDEALAEVCVDLVKRPYLVYSRCSSLGHRVGEMETELIEEFLRALSSSGRITLHAHIRYGSNSHHMVEALFKALGRALYEATRPSTIYPGTPSSKGTM